MLPDSPIARLGPVFARHFYYGTLVRDNLVHCHIAYVGDTAAGFIAYTHLPTFMAEGLRRHWFRLGVVLLWAAISNPRRIGVMFSTLGLMRRRSGKRESGEGELLSIGVLPEFRGKSAARQIGRGISTELLNAARADLHALGVDRCYVLVRQENVGSLALLQANGCWIARDREAPAGTLVLMSRCDGSPTAPEPSGAS